MSMNNISKYVIAITIIGGVYATFLVFKNPQPFGKIALLAFVVFGMALLIRQKTLRTVLLSIAFFGGLLFSVLGTRSLLFNMTNEELLESATKVNFSKSLFSESLKKAEVENKLVFIDFYTTWCPPCITYHMDVLNDKNVAFYMNKAFVNTKFNLYKGEGIKLKDTYDVYYVPRFLIVDTKGNIIEDISTDSTLTAERMLQISKKYTKY